MPRSSTNEVVGGFTHWTILDNEDFKTAADALTDTSVTVSALGIPAGGTVTDVSVYCFERFYDTTGVIYNTYYRVTAGDGTDPDGFITNQDCLSTGATANTGAYLQLSTGIKYPGKTYNSADTLDVTLTVDNDFTKFDAGKIVVGARILDPGSYIPS